MPSAAVAAAALAVAVLAGPAGGASPPVGGIAFARFPQVGESQLFVIGADGGVPRLLFGQREGSDAEPAWSPDGACSP